MKTISSAPRISSEAVQEGFLPALHFSKLFLLLHVKSTFLESASVCVPLCVYDKSNRDYLKKRKDRNSPLGQKSKE